MGPSPSGSNTQFRHFCQIRIAAQCPDTWAWVHSVQIPDSNIFAGLELLHSVRTHGPESNGFKYLILTCYYAQTICNAFNTFVKIMVNRYPSILSPSCWSDVTWNRDSGLGFFVSIINFVAESALNWIGTCSGPSGEPFGTDTVYPSQRQPKYGPFGGVLANCVRRIHCTRSVDRSLRWVFCVLCLRML